MIVDQTFSDDLMEHFDGLITIKMKMWMMWARRLK